MSLPTLSELKNLPDFRNADLETRLRVFDGWANEIQAEAGAIEDPREREKVNNWLAGHRGQIELESKARRDGLGERTLEAIQGVENAEDGNSLDSARRGVLSTVSGGRTVAAGAWMETARREQDLVNQIESEIGPGEAIYEGNAPKGSRLVHDGSGRRALVWIGPEGGKGAKSPEEFKQQVSIHQADLQASATRQLEKADTDTQAAQAFAQDAGMREFIEAEGFGKSAKALFENFHTIVPNAIAESLPSVGSAVVGGAVGGPAGAFAGGAGIEFSHSYREALEEFGKEAGIDTSTPEGLAKAMLDEKVNNAALERAGIRAGVIGSIDAASQGIAGQIVSKLGGKFLAEAGAAIAIEAPLEGVGEAAAQLASGQDFDGKDVVLESIAGGGQGVAMVGIQEAIRQGKESERKSFQIGKDEKGDVVETQTTGEPITELNESAQPSPAQKPNLNRYKDAEMDQAEEAAFIERNKQVFPKAPGEKPGDRGAEVSAKDLDAIDGDPDEIRSLGKESEAEPTKLWKDPASDDHPYENLDTEALLEERMRLRERQWTDEAKGISIQESARNREEIDRIEAKLHNKKVMDQIYGRVEREDGSLVTDYGAISFLREYVEPDLPLLEALGIKLTFEAPGKKYSSFSPSANTINIRTKHRDAQLWFHEVTHAVEDHLIKNGVAGISDRNAAEFYSTFAREFPDLVRQIGEDYVKGVDGMEWDGIAPRNQQAEVVRAIAEVIRFGQRGEDIDARERGEKPSPGTQMILDFLADPKADQTLVQKLKDFFIRLWKRMTGRAAELEPTDRDKVRQAMLNLQKGIQYVFRNQGELPSSEFGSRYSKYSYDQDEFMRNPERADLPPLYSLKPDEDGVNSPEMNGENDAARGVDSDPSRAASERDAEYLAAVDKDSILYQDGEPVAKFPTIGEAYSAIRRGGGDKRYYTQREQDGSIGVYEVADESGPVADLESFNARAKSAGNDQLGSEAMFDTLQNLAGNLDRPFNFNSANALVRKGYAAKVDGKKGQGAYAITDQGLEALGESVEPLAFERYDINDPVATRRAFTAMGRAIRSEDPEAFAEVATALIVSAADYGKRTGTATIGQVTGVPENPSVLEQKAYHKKDKQFITSKVNGFLRLKKHEDNPPPFKKEELVVAATKAVEDNLDWETSFLGGKDTRDQAKDLIYSALDELVASAKKVKENVETDPKTGDTKPALPPWLARKIKGNERPESNTGEPDQSGSRQDQRDSTWTGGEQERPKIRRRSPEWAARVDTSRLRSFRQRGRRLPVATIVEELGDGSITQLGSDLINDPIAIFLDPQWDLFYELLYDDELAQARRIVSEGLKESLTGRKVGKGVEINDEITLYLTDINSTRRRLKDYLRSLVDRIESGEPIPGEAPPSQVVGVLYKGKDAEMVETSIGPRFVSRTDNIDLVVLPDGTVAWFENGALREEAVQEIFEIGIADFQQSEDGEVSWKIRFEPIAITLDPSKEGDLAEANETRIKSLPEPEPETQSQPAPETVTLRIPKHVKNSDLEESVNRIGKDLGGDSLLQHLNNHFGLNKDIPRKEKRLFTGRIMESSNNPVDIHTKDLASVWDGIVIGFMMQLNGISGGKLGRINAEEHTWTKPGKTKGPKTLKASIKAAKKQGYSNQQIIDEAVTYFILNRLLDGHVGSEEVADRADIPDKIKELRTVGETNIELVGRGDGYVERITQQARERFNEIVKSMGDIDSVFRAARIAESRGRMLDQLLNDIELTRFTLGDLTLRDAANVLYQNAKGFFDTFTKFIGLTPKADESTTLHEPLHMVIELMKGTEQIKPLEEYYGVENGQWDSDQHEAFARHGERYYRDGIAPPNATQKIIDIFDRIKNILRRIYDKIRGSAIESEVPQVTREFLDDLTMHGFALMEQARENAPPITELNAAMTSITNPERVRPAPLPNVNVQPNNQVMFDLARELGINIRYGGQNQGTYGTYTTDNSRVSIAYEGDLDTTAHEVSHAIDDTYRIGQEIVDRGLEAVIDAELQVPAFMSTVLPGAQPGVTRAETLAEFMRAWMINPAEAEALAPEMSRLFTEIVPTRTLRALERFGRQIRAWEAAPPTEKLLANVQERPNTQMQEQLRFISDVITGGKKANQDGFVVTARDVVAHNWRDDRAIFFKAVDYVEQEQGLDILPEHDPRLLARLMLGGGSKHFEIVLNGMINARQEVVTGGGIDWLLQPFKKQTAAEVEQDFRHTIALMVAERTIEMAGRFKREVGLSGIGAGLMTDLEVADQVISELTQDPKRFARLHDAASRYRQWADANLRYLVEKGRLSEEAYQNIVNENTQYVALNRIMELAPGEEGISISTAVGNGKGLGTPAEMINSVTGSSKMIKNPYVTLIDTSARIVAEADRNEILAKFVDMFASERALYEGDPTQLASVATPVAVDSGAPQSILVYRRDENNRNRVNEERWQITDPDLYRSIMAMSKTANAPGILRIPADMLKWGITNMPSFAIRNYIRDVQSRLLVSRADTADNLRAMVPTNGNETLRRLRLGGGDQAGHYIRSETDYMRALEESMRDMATDRNTLLIAGENIQRFFTNDGPYRRLLERAEQANRIAEYKASYRYAQRTLGYDEFNAHLYAAGQARDLMDFAVAGEKARYWNQIIPFFNAAIQGTMRNIRAARENSLQFGLRFLMFAIFPTVAMRLLVMVNGDDDEYEELPDYLRDMYWNFKVAPDLWLRIPKNFEAGVLASSADRAISQIKGTENPWEGYLGSLGDAVIPTDTATLLGPYKAYAEVVLNKDLFRGKYIVSPFEADVALNARIRKSQYASRAGQAWQKLAEAMGMSENWVGITFGDARKFDSFVKGTLGNFGDTAVRASNIGRKDTNQQLGLKDVGLFVSSPAFTSKSVQDVYKKAKLYGLRKDKLFNTLDQLFQDYYNATPERARERGFAKVSAYRDAISKAIRTEASRIKPILEAEIRKRKEGAKPAPRQASAFNSIFQNHVYQV